MIGPFRRKGPGAEALIRWSGESVISPALVKGLGPAAADPSKLEIRHILVP